jgi:RimK family alpha-L-glutamate ligase
VAAARDVGLEAEWARPERAASRVRRRDVVLGSVDVLQSLDGVEPEIWELRRLEVAGVDVLNRAASLLASHDKLASALAFGRAGFRNRAQPRSTATTGTRPSSRLVVVKPRFGSWGRDVYLCRTARELRRCLRSLNERPWFQRHGALVQELIPPLGNDLRVIVAGAEVVGAVERVSAHGEWRTNVTLGARRLPVVPPPEACELAIRAAAAVEAELVGIDLLPLPDGGYVVLEVNGAAEFTDEYSLSGGDVFEDAARQLASHADEPLAATVEFG